MGRWSGGARESEKRLPPEWNIYNQHGTASKLTTDDCHEVHEAGQGWNAPHHNGDRACQANDTRADDG